jgi:endonuclease YncB( thermonuclease family)
LGFNALAEIVPYRRPSKTRRKTHALFARWSYLPWQPLAVLMLVATTFITIQFVSTSTHQLSDELRNAAVTEAVNATRHATTDGTAEIVDDGATQPSAEVDRSASTSSVVVDRTFAANVSMPLCKGWPRVNCVIDGDTIWYRGEKIRIADINAPETHDPHCAYEADLGRRATDRMISLLNGGPFEVAATGDRDEDVYGRKLRIVERNGRSLGQILVSEGLAERWQGYRRNWCA